MSFEIIRKTGEIAFVANPIAFEVKTSGEAEIEIRLRVGAQEVFSASYVPFGDRIHFDIAEILQPFVTSGPLEDSEDLILPVSGFMAGYTLEVKGRETRTLTGKVICGGISKQASNCRMLSSSACVNSCSVIFPCASSARHSPSTSSCSSEFHFT